MRQAGLVAALALGLFVVTAVPALALASAGDEGGTNSLEGDVSSLEESDIAPGEQMAGVVSVQEVELEGEIDNRAFGIQLAGAATEEAQADVVGERLGSIEERLEELEERKDELEQKRADGTITEGQYNARMATLTAMTASIRHQTNQTEQAARELPTEALRKHGVDVDQIEAIREWASDLSGPDASQIARNIAGPDPGGMPAGHPDVPPDLDDAPADDQPADDDE